MRADNNQGRLEKMDHHTSDMLFPLMLLGDYVRAGIQLSSKHPLIKRLGVCLANTKLIGLHINEAAQRQEVLRNSFKQSREKQSIFPETLPGYCRLHSVLHGLMEWERRFPKAFTETHSQKVQELTKLDLQTIELFGEWGLCLERAEEILIMAGRGLVNMDMNCFLTLPQASSAPYIEIMQLHPHKRCLDG